MQGKLEQAMEKIEAFNAEEEAYGWETSQRRLKIILLNYDMILKGKNIIYFFLGHYKILILKIASSVCSRFFIKMPNFSKVIKMIILLVPK